MVENVLSKILLIIPRKASSEFNKRGTTTSSTGNEHARPIKALPSDFLLFLLPQNMDLKVTPIFPNVEAAE